MNTLSVSDIVTKVANPYVLMGERSVCYGEEEYDRAKNQDPDLPKPDIDFFKWLKISSSGISV